MSGNIDILLRLPDVATIGRTKLQDYCDEWLKLPIAREFGISHLIVGSDLLLTANVDLQRVKVVDNRISTSVFEVLDYIIDHHFHEPAKRRELLAQTRDIRRRWGVVGYQYQALAGRVGRLWLKCKNPDCDASMETVQQAVEGQTINCPPSKVTCPVCGHPDWYDGNDLHLRLDR